MNPGEQRYCEQCGAPLGPSARFCGKCGQPVAQATVPSSPPPQPPVQPVSRAQAQACTAMQATPKKKRAPILGRILAVLAGLALIFLGLRGPILGIAGQPATAVISDVSPSDGDDYEHRIAYSFSVGGKIYTGAWYQKAPNVATLPNEGAQISIRYLPAWPSLNTPTRQSAPNLTSLLLVGLGALLILFNGKVRIG